MGRRNSSVCARYTDPVAGELGAQHFGENTGPQHPVDNGPFEGCLRRKFRIEVQRIIVARDAGEGFYVGLRKPERVGVCIVDLHGDKGKFKG